MTANLARGPLTDLLLETLADVGMPVGDNESPAEPHGWQGEPNDPAAHFLPYLVLCPLTASTSSGPFNAPQADWQLPYQIQAFGVARSQCEWLADRARELLGALRHTVLTLGAQNYKVQQVRTESIGGISRLESTNPPYFGQADGVSVWLTRE